MDPPSRLAILIAISALALTVGTLAQGAEVTKAAEPSPPAAGGGNGLPFTQDSNGNGNGTKVILPYLVDGIVGCGQAPVDVALNSTLSHIYLVCRDENTLCVLDSITRDVLARIALGGEGSAVVADPYANKVYVADATRGVVTVVDAVLLEVTKTIHVGGEPRRLAIDPERRRLYVADGRARVVRVVDCRRNVLIQEVDLPAAPSALAVDPGNGRLAITSRAGRTLTMVDPASPDDVKTLDLPAQPGDVLMEPETGAVFVALPAAGKVMVIDQDKLVTVDVGTAPYSLAFDRARGIVFVGDVEGRQVLLMDASSKEILQRVDIAEAPVRLLFDQSDRSVYVMPDEGNHVRKLVVQRPQAKSSLPSRSRRGPRLATKIVGGLVGAVGAIFRKARGFAQVTYEDDDNSSRKTRTVEEEVRMFFGGALGSGRGRNVRYSGNVGWKHARVKRDGALYETEDLVYGLELSLLPRSRAALTLSANHDVSDVATDVSGARRLVTDTRRAEWALRPWDGTRVFLTYEETDVEDSFDAGGFFTATERFEAKLRQSLPSGKMMLDYDVIDRQGSTPSQNRRTEELEFRTAIDPTENVRLDLDYQYRASDPDAGSDTESHVGHLRTNYRRGDRLTARFDLRADVRDSGTSESSALSALADVQYYPLRTQGEIWRINLLTRVHGTERETPAATPSVVESGGGTVGVSAYHATNTPRFELRETYEVGYNMTDLLYLDRSEVYERAELRANFRHSDRLQLWGEGELRFRQRDQAGVRDLITDAQFAGGVTLDVPRRLDVRAEVRMLLTNEPGRPSSDTTASLDGEWTVHDHRWAWGSDRILVGLDIRERLSVWSEWWYLRYEYRARLTKLSLTTFDLRREWRSTNGRDASLMEARLGFRYDIGQLTMRVEYIYRDAEGWLGQDRNYLLARVRRTF